MNLDVPSIDTLIIDAIRLFESSDSTDILDKNHKSYLGKNGKLNAALKSLSSVPLEDRKVIGSSLNEAKNKIQEAYVKRKKTIKTQEIAFKLSKDNIDVTLSGRSRSIGSHHPITLTINKIISFFNSLGFDAESGPEIETDYYNFEALNVPEDHPAKDMHDTFYLDNGFLLRTHTSPVQIRTMENQKPPLRIICPGRVYRKDSDITHTPMFHQIEGLVIEKEASFSMLKGLIRSFLQDYFGSDIVIRFRPSYFPFTEPSAEVDIKWEKGWLEVMGCGMVHPKVLKNCGINPNNYSAFAFGMGPERMAMLKYGIDDLRNFFENDFRFLEQF